MQTVVFYTVDAEKGEGVELAERYKVQGYPTFIVTNADAETIQIWTGYDTPGDFVEMVADTVADPTTIEEKIARYENKPSLADELALGRYYAASAEYVKAADYFERALEREESEPGLAYDAFVVYRYGFEDDAFDVDQVTAAADRAMNSGALDAEQHLYLARLMSKAASPGADWSPAPYIERALAETEGIDDPDLQDIRRNVLIDQALKITGDTDRALELKRETLSEGWEEDAESLNSFAWWCFENKLNLEQAETVARRGVELAAEDEEKAMILDTVAEIVYLRGNDEEALTLIQQAMELHPESDYYKEQALRFGGESSGVM